MKLNSILLVMIIFSFFMTFVCAEKYSSVSEVTFGSPEDAGVPLENGEGCIRGEDCGDLSDYGFFILIIALIFLFYFLFKYSKKSKKKTSKKSSKKTRKKRKK